MASSACVPTEVKKYNTDSRRQHQKFWRADEDDRLLVLVRKKLSNKLIAREIGRSVEGVAWRIRKLRELGLDIPPRKVGRIAKLRNPDQDRTDPKRPKYPKWTHDDDALLEKMWVGGESIKDIATALNRTCNAVSQRCQRTSIPPRKMVITRGKAVADDEILYVRRQIAKGVSHKKIGAVLGRSKSSISGIVDRYIKGADAPSESGYVWTSERRKRLCRLFADGASLKYAAHCLGASIKAVDNQRRRQGIRPNGRIKSPAGMDADSSKQPLSSGEIKVLRGMYDRGKSAIQCASELQRSVQLIEDTARFLRINNKTTTVGMGVCHE